MSLNEWIDLFLKEFPDINMELVNLVPMEYKELEDKGVIVYTIIKGFTSKKELNELFFYLKPEHRTLKNANILFDMFEEIGKEENCDVIKIASNSGYRDKAFTKFLLRKGYVVDTVSKEI